MVAIFVTVYDVIIFHRKQICSKYLGNIFTNYKHEYLAGSEVPCIYDLINKCIVMLFYYTKSGCLIAY